MYIFIKRDSATNKVLTVETIGAYRDKAEQEALDAVKKYNASHDYTRYEAVNVEDEGVSEALMFLLGEDKYKATKTKWDVVELMESLAESLSEVEGDICSLRNDFDFIRDAIKGLKEE